VKHVGQQLVSFLAVSELEHTPGSKVWAFRNQDRSKSGDKDYLCYSDCIRTRLQSPGTTYSMHQYAALACAGKDEQVHVLAAVQIPARIAVNSL